MKNYLFTFLILSYQYGIAQEITLDWFPKIGTEIEYDESYVESTDDYPFPEEGENVIWDYENLMLGGPGSGTKIKWVKPEEGNFVDTLSSDATILKVVETWAHYWEYYYYIPGDTIYSSAGIYQKTIGENEPLVYLRNKEEAFFMFDGFELGERFFGNAVTDAYVQFYGEGTLITPYATFDNCIAIKTDTPNGSFTFVTWYFENLNQPVARYQINNDSKLVYISCATESFQSTSNTDEFLLEDETIQLQFHQQLSKLEIVNPSTSKIEVKVSIFNNNSQVVLSQNQTLEEGSNWLKINHENYPGGVYHVVLTTNEKDSKVSQSFLITQN